MYFLDLTPPSFLTLLLRAKYLRPCLQAGRVALLPGLKDSPGLQAKFAGRVTLLPETTLRLLRFGNLESKARTDNKTGK